MSMLEKIQKLEIELLKDDYLDIKDNEEVTKALSEAYSEAKAVDEMLKNFKETIGRACIWSEIGETKEFTPECRPDDVKYNYRHMREANFCPHCGLPVIASETI